MIRSAREAAGLSQEDLASSIGLANHSPISRVETESLKGPIPPDLFNAITGALRALSPIELLRAMGYELVMPSRDRVLPPALVSRWDRLGPDQKQVVLQLVHGFLGESMQSPGRVE